MTWQDSPSAWSTTKNHRRQSIKPGDAIIGLASTGLHSNGYSLARRVLFDKAKLTITSRCLDSIDRSEKCC